MRRRSRNAGVSEAGVTVRERSAPRAPAAGGRAGGGAVSRLAQVLRADWPELLLQILVVILGITISFWLNEWRTSVSNRATEIRVLQDLRDNLVADSTMLVQQSRRLVRMLHAYDALRSPARMASLPRDSVDVYLDLAITYVLFAHNDDAYEEMKQTGTSRLFRNKELLNRIITLYNTGYTRAREWEEINRRFILDRMIPYLDDHAPYVEGGMADGVLTGTWPIYEHLGRQDQFLNLLRTNRLFKEAQLSVFGATLEQVRGLIGDIERELPD